MSTQEQKQPTADIAEPQTKEEPTNPIGITQRGVLTFQAEKVNPHLVCKLCTGYFREPFTIVECMHKFCKSCIVVALESGIRNCPTCGVSLGPDPRKGILFDRTMHEIVNKIFPQIEKKDEENEREFYCNRNIKKKAKFRNSDVSAKKRDRDDGCYDRSRTRMLFSAEDFTNVNLAPHSILSSESSSHMPRLQKPCLKVPGKIKVIQIKKFLVMKLPECEVKDTSSIEVLCNGAPVGDELSIIFINRTNWDKSLGDLTLTYRLNEENFF